MKNSHIFAKNISCYTGLLQQVASWVKFKLDKKMTTNLLV